MKDHVTVVPSDKVIIVDGNPLQFETAFDLESGHMRSSDTK